MAKHEIHLVIPATRNDALIARMAVSGLGMLCGLDVGLIGDLRTVTNECCDCLIARRFVPDKLDIAAAQEDKRLRLIFTAVGTTEAAGQPLDRDIAYGVLSTLMPEVSLQEDEQGIVQICCSMPVGGDGCNE